MIDDFVKMTADVVSAYVAHNSIRAQDVPDLIKQVHESLHKTVQVEPEPVEAKSEKKTPAEIRKSIHHDYLVSFEDGKRYRTLKRHLSTRGLTLDDYKAKHGLPKDYPSVSPAYSQKRSGLAKQIGLGNKGRNAQDSKAEAAPEPAKAEAKTEPKKAESKVQPHLKSDQTRRSKTKAAKDAPEPAEAA